MSELILGPLLRYVGEGCAVIWVETDTACEVTVNGFAQRTFHIEGHHFALVRMTGLEPGSVVEYTVALDGDRVWPQADSRFPPSVIRLFDGASDERIEVAFGSCRVAAPNEPPYTFSKDDDDRGRELDALRALALRMHHEPVERWPDLLLLLGDQVYADEVSPEAREFVETRRDIEREPGPIALDFEEYTRLYRESWTEPVVRWLLSTVPSAMIFDDHDVHDDWNTSSAWLERARATDWWEEHIIGGLMSYWVYQHLGNLSPAEQDEDDIFQRVYDEDNASELLRDFAYRADRQQATARWSYHRDLGSTRLVVIDTRCSRVLKEGSRAMLDDREMRWIEEHATGGFDHLLLASSVPWLLGPAMHHLEAWNEAVCGGAWGRLAARGAEWIRQALDLEHWAAFNASFEHLCELQRAVGAGERGAAPATIVTLSGDVHHAYVSNVAFKAGSGVKSGVYQAVCSPMRNPLDHNERRVIRAMTSKPLLAATRALSHSAGVEEPSVRWRMVGDGPWFDNQVASLHIAGRRMECTIEKALDSPGDGERGVDEPRLEPVMHHRLA